MKLHVCVPTLSQYDRLRQLIASVQASSLKPTDLWVIDNGQRWIVDREVNFLDEQGIQHHYVKFGENIGCAKSWNWFIDHTTDYRVIANDDILFLPDTLQRLVDAFDPNTLLCPENIVGGNAFSCFLLPDALYGYVGVFDEGISPNYCYYEDVDYSLRLRRAGFSIQGVAGCRVEHAHSATYRAYTKEQRDEHDHKFNLAQSNYVRKWGGMPGKERN